MAKKDKQEEIDIDNYGERVLKLLESQFPKTKVIYSADDIKAQRNLVLSWSPALDEIIYGVPVGSWISCAGPSGSGKTTSLLKLAANAQAAGMSVWYLDVEHRIQDKFYSGIKGLKTEPPHFNIIQSSKGNIMGTAKFLTVAEIILRNHPNIFMIVDSVSSLVDEREQEGEIGTQTRGHNNVVITQWINRNAPVPAINGSILAGVLQQYANTSGYGAGPQEKGPTKWFFQSDIRLVVKGFKVEMDSAGIKPVGQDITWVCKKSALGPPEMKTEKSFLRYGVGLDEVREMIRVSEPLGLIQRKSAGWMVPIFLGEEADDNKIQGEENMYEWLTGNPNILEKLKTKYQEIIKIAR